MNKIQLRSKAKALEPILRIGKNGLTENVIKEIGSLLKEKKLIKIKMLKPAISKNKKEMINKIVEKTDSELIEAVGNIAVLYRE